MTKQDILKAIENGESVWACRNNIVYKVALDSSWVYIENDILKWYSPVNKILGHKYYSINELYKTKAEAEHYLHHANVTRTEQLPFYTFSEIAKDEKNFKMGKTYTLIEDKNFVLDINKSYVSQIVLYTGKEKYSWNFNEENFYKAYDECVRLFRGEE